ncbi:MAG: TolC family protein [Bacteroidales bacterium]|nr:TolC family protein [Bacteroidales bacterium]
MFQRLTFLAISLGCYFVSTAAQSHQDSDTPRVTGDSLPENWTYTPPMTQDIPAASDVWWKSFNDATLDSLISLALSNNYNVAMALHRTEIARNTMKQAQSQWYPSVGLQAGWSKSQTSGAMRVPTTTPTITSGFNAGLNASWEIDLFGKIADGVKSKRASYNASRAEYAGAMVSLCAQVASTYFNLRTLQGQLSLAESHTESQQKTVTLARARFEAELASKLDVDQAQENYYTTLSSIPQYKYSINAAINALEVLTGSFSTELREKLMEPAPLPDCYQLIATGVPAELLRRRPDIVEAEQELAAYATQIGIAKKDFLPTLVIEGSVGTSARNLGDLFTRRSVTYTVAPTLSWTLFDGLSRKYSLANAREQMQLGIENYNLTVANAFQETDNAIASYNFSLMYLDEINNILHYAGEAVNLAIDRYKNSLSPMLEVVTEQMNLLSAEQEQISARGKALNSLVTLYEALGGGFNADTYGVKISYSIINDTTNTSINDYENNTQPEYTDAYLGDINNGIVSVEKD